MRSQKHKRRALRRRGFTLIEMLVVILIILLLAGLVMAFMPGVSARQQSERGGIILRTALNQTKQNARRDNRAAGIRIIPNGNFCTNPQFIQKPDDLGGGIMQANGQFSTTALCQNANGVGQVTLTGGNLFGAVLAGDTIEVAGCGEPHIISQANGAVLTLNSPFLNLAPINPNPQATQLQTAQYRIMRSPRLMMGEPPVALPQDVGIDVTLGGVFSTGTLSAGGQPTSFANAGSGDILFSPSGQVVGAFTGCDAVVLWVRDTVVSTPTQGFPVLVVIYGKTGFITQQPVNPTGDAYLFVRNALSSGM
jgi:prepilin-type N-terminal cleavage/methylation domain-containing protein